MVTVDHAIQSYIQANVLPKYKQNDKGHGMEHIDYVTKRSLAFAEQFEDIDVNIVYTVASYHDIAHSIDPKNHEKLSAEMFFGNEEMKQFFTEAERILIKEAIEDHRASLDAAPRSIYGEIISSADRSTDVEDFLRRTHAYTLKHFPKYTEQEVINRAYDHAVKKYGQKGYAKHYVKDAEYDKFREHINFLISDKERFAQKYKEING